MTSSAPHAKDRAVTALGLALCAVAVGYAIDINDGRYDPWALFWLSVGIAVCITSILLPPIHALERICDIAVPYVIATGIAMQAALMLCELQSDYHVVMGIIVIAMLGFLQMFRLRGLRVPLVIIMAGALCPVGFHAFLVHAPNPGIDVFTFQQEGSKALLSGHDPYSTRIWNNYDELQTKMFYGPGVVGPDNRLNFGYPYPPLSLLLVLPGYLLGGDVRFALVVAMAISAVLMAFARPGRWGALAAALFLLTPRAVYVMDLAWIEPLQALTFSIMLFCACRWRAALPWTVGLFISTKQYNVLMLPILYLLVDEPGGWRAVRGMLVKAGIVVAVINLPFFLWNPRNFLKATVLWQIIQPFRPDALSYLVWIYRNFQGYKAPPWTTVLAVALATVAVIWKGLRSPAGFAAGLTLINLAFFAVNKQAFCNYYYFVVCTCCWTVAASRTVKAAP